jgi:hypothetical protein
MKMEFKVVVLENFCAQLAPFPHLVKTVLKTRVAFMQTYLCEVGFSSLETDVRNCLNVNGDLCGCSRES